tara:strand:+ start:85 stop:441 length:357 start_codon:yes stop_codon:yes gene_type:complete
MSESKQRTVDLLAGAFDLQQRRKFTVKKADGSKVVDLYFKPVTRSERTRAMGAAGTQDALKLSTQFLVQMAELENGTKAFSQGDISKLQRELPEKVLTELELFLFDLEDPNIEASKKD